MRGGGFFIVESLFATFSPCGGNLATFFSVWGAVFSQFKGLFCSFFPCCCRGFFATFVSLWRFFLPFKSLSATFFSMLGLFCYVFFQCGGLFSLFEGPFATFFSFWGRPFPPFKGLSATFFLHAGVLFLFLLGPFFCVSLNPYE